MNRSLSLDNCKMLMLIFTVSWFAATPLWMGRDLPDDEDVTAPNSR